jgi:hypothetical protein
MKSFLYLFSFCLVSFSTHKEAPQKIFDVHIHGTKNVPGQLQALNEAGVYKAAVSTSWDLQNSYRSETKMELLYGLMFPCPNGKVPYSLQPCFEDKKEWPSVAWVEQQIKEKKLDFFGEILAQYYGISSSDTLLHPYYALAEKYGLPVGIHTGSAGPDHGSPNFKEELGNPILMQNLLGRFPKLKVWIMHSGAPFLKEAIAVMQEHETVYADISAISNPAILPPAQFAASLCTRRSRKGTRRWKSSLALSATKPLLLACNALH